MNEEPCKCSKCGRPVPKHNSVAWFEWCLNSVGEESMRPEPSESQLSQDWHLFPVPADADGGSCEGSPSRLQYFPGQPKDTRKRFRYRAVLEPMHRMALKLYRGHFPLPEASAATT